MNSLVVRYAHTHTHTYIGARTIHINYEFSVNFNKVLNINEQHI